MSAIKILGQWAANCMCFFEHNDIEEHKRDKPQTSRMLAS